MSEHTLICAKVTLAHYKVYKHVHCNLERHGASWAQLATVSTDDFIETIGPIKHKCHNYHTRAELLEGPGACSLSKLAHLSNARFLLLTEL